MMNGNETHKKLNRFLDVIPYGINALRQVGVVIEKSDEDFLCGSSLIMYCSYLESIMDSICPAPFRLPNNFPRHTMTPYITKVDYWAEKYDKNKSRWYAWKEFENMYRLRHCFVHNNGKLLTRHDTRIKTFHSQLNGDQVLDRDGKPVSSYFEINGNTIKVESLKRFKILVMEFLVLVGEISPFKTNSGSWVRF